MAPQPAPYGGGEVANDVGQRVEVAYVRGECAGAAHLPALCRAVFRLDAGGAVQLRPCVDASDVEQLPYVGFRPVGKVEGGAHSVFGEASAQAAPDAPYLPYRRQFECAPALCVVGNGAHRVVGRVAFGERRAYFGEGARGRYSEGRRYADVAAHTPHQFPRERLCLCRGGVVVEGDEGLVDRVYLHIRHERCYGGHHARGYVAVEPVVAR